MTRAPVRRLWLLWILFGISGACGLSFELLWTRQLGVTLGATSRAIAVVVAAFMAGLALGSAVGSRLATRSRRPAFGYGLLELAIGSSALVTTSLLPGIEAVGSMGARYALSLPLLLVPTVLMGATYPFVCETARFLEGREGRLYALNTIGAALGCLLVGFAGVGLLGVTATARIAAAGNLLCGLAAVLLVGDAGRARDGDGAPPVLARVPREMTLVALGCGASALAAEVLWTRALVPYLNSSTYAFAAILACYLLFLSMGAGLGAARAMSWDLARTRSRLAALQLALAVCLAASIALMDAVERFLQDYSGIRRVMSLGAWLETVWSVLSRVTLVIALPTMLMGASFPLVVKLARGEARAVDGIAARISAWNTLGGIVGSVGAGFVLLPLVGVLHALLVCALVNAAIALVLVPRRPAWVGAFAAVALVTFVVAGSGRAVPFVGRIAEGGRVLLVDEGPQDTTAVVELASRAGVARTIFSNGVSYTGDNPASRRYMRLLGHLPVLLADDPAHSLVICVGTGMTAAAVARYAAVRTLDLVDISPAVRRTMPLFRHVNASVFADPRVTLHEADGRNFLGRSTRRFGVISLEPPPPRAAGAASLYTEELYRMARARLTPGGAIAQWLPLHGLTDAELRIITRTFVRVFPDGALFLLNDAEAALLAAGPIDLARIERRLGQPGIAGALAELGFDTSSEPSLAAQLLALSLAKGSALRRAMGPGPVITDDRPLVEQFAITLSRGGQSTEQAERARFLRRVVAR